MKTQAAFLLLIWPIWKPNGMAQQFKANPTAVPDTDFSPGMWVNESMSGSSEGGTAPQSVRKYVEASFGFQNEWRREPMT